LRVLAISLRERQQYDRHRDATDLAFAIAYLKKFGYSGAQAYSILGTAPCQGHISGVVDVPNACATLWLPTEIFDFDVMPSSTGPVKHIKGDIQMPLSQDK
jgi:formamidase